MINYNRIKRDSDSGLFDMWLDFECINFWLCFYYHELGHDWINKALSDLTKYPYM